MSSAGLCSDNFSMRNFGVEQMRGCIDRRFYAVTRYLQYKKN